MLNLIRRQLGFHPVQTLFVCVAIGSSLAVIFLLEGFQLGLLVQLRKTVQERGGDLIVAQAGVTSFIASRSVLPQLSRERIETVDGVRAAHPLTLVPVIYEQNNRKTPVILVVYDTIGGPTGIQLQMPSQIVIGRSLAVIHDLNIGDRFMVGGYAFNISGIVDNASVMFTPLAFITYDDLIDWYFNSDIVGDISNLPLLGFLVDVEPDADLQSVRDAIEVVEQNGDVFVPTELAVNDQAIGRTLFGPVMNALIYVGYVICFLMIGIISFSISQAQQRNFGIIKAVGFTNQALTVTILLQILLLIILAFPIGLLIAELITIGVEHMAPLYTIEIFHPSLMIRTGVVAILLAGLGALASMRVIIRVDPATVFRR